MPTDAQFAWLLPAAITLYFCFALTLSIIDFQTLLLPDKLTLPLLWCGLLFHCLVNPHNVIHAVYGAIAGYGFLWVIFQIYRLLTGKHGLGYGDFKLLAAIGAWNFWQNLPAVIIAASLQGMIFAGLLYLVKRSRVMQIPFGPWLAIAGWGNFVWQIFG
ncbi:prepilin peptidase [Cedecea sp.]|jgi:prepilin signal peptidase PulO-like enzyme (type II secretory pathway)|uniref:prepilin peptidase n=1 Tax=Cedecea sp. TaxID=1970739 RepID=UPI0012AD6599|nr:prepilin peptidase [Enterobacteriaceae bacterium RIT693]